MSSSSADATVGVLFGTYYTTYFGVSEYNTLHEKIAAGSLSEEQSTKLPSKYEYPKNINIPSSSWLKGIQAGPTYAKLSTSKEPLDGYDVARLRNNFAVQTTKVLNM